MCGWVGMGCVELCWRPYSAGAQHSVSDHIQNLLDHPKQKPRRGGGLRQIDTCRKVLFTEIFFR